MVAISCGAGRVGRDGRDMDRLYTRLRVEAKISEARQVSGRANVVATWRARRQGNQASKVLRPGRTELCGEASV